MDSKQFALDQAVKYHSKGVASNNVKHIIDTAKEFMLFLDNQLVKDNSKESLKIDHPQNPAKPGTASQR